jgi:hypothetical protein
MWHRGHIRAPSATWFIVCGRNLITGLTSAASPRVDISNTYKVGQKLGVSLPLLTSSPSAWPSRLLYRRGRKSRRDLWITLYNTHLSIQLSVATLKPCQMELHPVHRISLSICHPDVYVQEDYVFFIPYTSQTAVNTSEVATKGTDRKYSTKLKHMWQMDRKLSCYEFFHPPTAFSVQALPNWTIYRSYGVLPHHQKMKGFM